LQDKLYLKVSFIYRECDFGRQGTPAGGSSDVLEKKPVQARYLLPETARSDSDSVKNPDAIVDSYLMEIKSITGSINQVEYHFRESHKKAVSDGKPKRMRRN
jgi:hypothetical protein